MALVLWLQCEARPFPRQGNIHSIDRRMHIGERRVDKYGLAMTPPAPRFYVFVYTPWIVLLAAFSCGRHR
jgi:hypothetical protein